MNKDKDNGDGRDGIILVSVILIIVAVNRTTKYDADYRFSREGDIMGGALVEISARKLKNEVKSS